VRQPGYGDGDALDGAEYVDELEVDETNPVIGQKLLRPLQ